MFSNDFVLSVLVDGKIVKENAGIIDVPFEGEYQIRLRNKNRLNCATDIYVDGERINEVGQIVIFGNDYVDLQGFLKKDGNGKKFTFAKIKDSRIKQPGESQNGIIEAKFYLQKEKEIVEHTVIHDYTYRPIYIYRESWSMYPWQPYWYDSYYGNAPRYGGVTFADNKAFVSNNAGGGISTSAGINLDPYMGHNFSHSSDIGKIECNAGAGATIEGNDFKPIQGPKVTFDLSQEPTTLRLQLNGYIQKIIKCTKCGAIPNTGWQFCPKCGGKIGR